jgi:hypothetical protein
MFKTYTAFGSPMHIFIHPYILEDMMNDQYQSLDWIIDASPAFCRVDRV